METFRNRILSRLPTDSIQRLQLRPLPCPLRYGFEQAGEPIRGLFFLEDGLGSMITSFLDGSQVEVSAFGNEGVIGSSALIGTRRSLNNTFMQIPGRGYMSPLSAAQAEFDRNELFHHLVLRYLQAALTEVMQNAACNARHPIERRLARWLLISADRLSRDTVDLSHEFLSQMLGATRSTVTVAAGDLRTQGLIDYSRGSIQILDRPGLERVACECYPILRENQRNFIDTDLGFVP